MPNFVLLSWLLKGVGLFLPFLQSPWKLGLGLLSHPLLRSSDWEEVRGWLDVLTCNEEGVETPGVSAARAGPGSLEIAFLSGFGNALCHSQGATLCPWWSSPSGQAREGGSCLGW